MSKVWPGPEDTQPGIEHAVASEPNDYRNLGNLSLGAMGIGVEALGGVDVVEGNSRDIFVVAFGLFMLGIGYLSSNGGVSSSLADFRTWAADKLLQPAGSAETEVEQIDSPPVIV